MQNLVHNATQCPALRICKRICQCIIYGKYLPLYFMNFMRLQISHLANEQKFIKYYN